MFFIGSVKVEHPTVLAPLAGITNLPLRLLAKEAGCGLVCSEMISANGLVYGAAKTHQMLASTPAEKPLSLQIFGSAPGIMAEAARIVEESAADIIDINCGCSVKKILKSGSGSALMDDLERTTQILKAVRAAVKIPLTIKMRTGWDPSGKQALNLARIAESCGVNAVALHPRTARQGFGGTADWGLIKKMKSSLSIPVIGNGDIMQPEDALRMKSQTGCDGVMVGRAAIGNPMIFGQINALLAGRQPSPVPLEMRIRIMERYVQDSVRYLGETRACYMLRSRLAWFVKGLANASHFRQAIRSIRSKTMALHLIREFADMNKICLSQAEMI